MFRFALCILLSLTLAGSLFARSNYRGYSGAPGSLGTCASSCHGSGGGTVEITGFPTEYVPDSTYLITITAVSGSSINNFNGSVRVGTGSTNAGTISGGTGTATYNVTGETNGIHLSSNNRTSGTFNWLAPASGTGTVRLHSGAFQGTNMNSGRSTSITLVATEAVVESPPDQASNPVPVNGDNGVDVDSTTLHWSPASLADHYDVYFGSTEPLFLLGSTSDTTIGNLSLDYEINFLWRVDAVNEFGTTIGETWSFLTEQYIQAGVAGNPLPINSDTDVPISTNLYWSAESADYFDVYFGIEWPLSQISVTSDTFIVLPDTLAYNTTYYWLINSHNEHSVTTGELWSFTTEAVNAAHNEPIANEFTLSQAYPNPFNSSVRISLNVPIESQATVSIFDQTGRLVSTMLDNSRVNGIVELEWDATGHSAGVYFLRCECAGVSLARKLVYLP